jgi:hypothetical protein
MERVRVEDTLAEHALVPRRKFDLGDGEGMAEVKGTVHVRKREVAEPFGELGLNLLTREALGLLGRGRVRVEQVLLCPPRLRLLLERNERVALAGLVHEHVEYEHGTHSVEPHTCASSIVAACAAMVRVGPKRRGRERTRVDNVQDETREREGDRILGKDSMAQIR